MLKHKVLRYVFASLMSRPYLVYSLPSLSAKSAAMSPIWSIDSQPPPENRHSRLRDRDSPAASAAAAAGVPTSSQQPQKVTNTADMGNSSDPSPGAIINNPIINPEVNCTDLTSGRDNKCWSELNLTQWVEEWLLHNPCYEAEAFASCFLRKEGFPGLDCTGIKISACTSPPTVAGLDPKVFYVAYNIYAINQFFLSWYTAVGNAASLAVDNVDEIVQIIDPPSNTNLILDDVLIGLTGIFAILPGPLGLAADAVKGFSEAWKTAAQVLENALFVVPQIGRFLFPIDNAASQVIQMADLKTRLASLIETTQGNLNSTLVSVMANTTEFLAFASQGNFTASAPSLPDEANYLLYAFNTYIISAGLKGNNVYGVLAKDTDVKALATNGTKLNYGIQCTDYNEVNVCDTWWYSQQYNSTFGLDDFSHMNRNYGDIMTALFQNYTTGQLLFDAAYNCNKNGNYGSPVNITVNAGGVNTACLSQLEVVTWDMQCTNPNNHKCEFAEIPPQNTFLGNCGSHSAYSVMDDPIYCVPYSYLGPLITQDKLKLERS